MSGTIEEDREETTAETVDETPEPDTGDVSEHDDGAEDGEPAEPLEPDDDEEPEASAGDDTDAARVLSEKEISKRYDKLQRENERHASRLGEIMGDDANDLIPCPVCMDGIAGWIYPPDVAPLSDEAVGRIRQVIGLPDLTTFRPAKFAERCPDCDGLGQVLTGSQVPGSETTTCERCGRNGWIRNVAPPVGVGVPPVAEEVITGPTVYVDDTADSEIRHLRERGFTVIPPLQVPGQ